MNNQNDLINFLQGKDTPKKAIKEAFGEFLNRIEDAESYKGEKIYQHGVANGIEGMQRVNPNQIREIEPHVKGIDGVHVGCTGIIDFRRATEVMCELGVGMNNNSKVNLGEGTLRNAYAYIYLIDLYENKN